MSVNIREIIGFILLRLILRGLAILFVIKGLNPIATIIFIFTIPFIIIGLTYTILSSLIQPNSSPFKIYVMLVLSELVQLPIQQAPIYFLFILEFFTMLLVQMFLPI